MKALKIEFKGDNPFTPEQPDYLCFTANKAGATLRMIGEVHENYTGDHFALEYSTDGKNWQELNFTEGEVQESVYSRISDTLTFTEIGDKVYFRGNNPYGNVNFNQDGTFGFIYHFGSATENSSDNSFAISGDLQTIKNKNGRDKVAGCYGPLFAGAELVDYAIEITSVPDLTATTLTPGCYYLLFAFQENITTIANMPQFTYDDLPEPLFGEVGCFTEMYAFTGVTTPYVFEQLVLPDNFGLEDFRHFALKVMAMFGETTADMTTDNGETLEMFPQIQFPLAVEEDGEQDIVSSYDFADNILFNVNGFDTVNIHGYASDIVLGQIELKSNEHDTYINTSGEVKRFWIQTGDTVSIALTGLPDSIYVFQKWQTSADEGTTWTDAGTDNPMTLTFSQPTDYYIKMEAINKMLLVTLNVGYNPDECEVDCFYDDPQPVQVRTLEPGDEDYPFGPFTTETVCQAMCINTEFGANCSYGCTPKEGYEFVKWQGLSDGSWIDFGNANPQSSPLGSAQNVVYVKAICQLI